MAKAQTKKSKKALVLIKELAPWKKIRGLDQRLEKAAQAVFENLPENLHLAAQKGEVNVLLASDAAIERLNFDYRGKKKPTNVLSFPQYNRREMTRDAKTEDALFLGDIVVAYQYVAKEAKAEDKIFLDHVTHLVIHGVLHLFGYDHLTFGPARKMEKLEQKIMAQLGLPDPYALPEAPVKKTTRGKAIKGVKKK